MPLITTLAGGAMGVSLQLYTNAVRRLPLMRRKCITARLPLIWANHTDTGTTARPPFPPSPCARASHASLRTDPWEHVLYFGVGGWAANKLVDFEAEQSEELRRTIERQGRPAKPFPPFLPLLLSSALGLCSPA